jgi:hypothetical protein
VKKWAMSTAMMLLTEKMPQKYSQAMQRLPQVQNLLLTLSSVISTSTEKLMQQMHLQYSDITQKTP